MKIKKWFLDVLKGASLGLGMIPGVSAGTMALIVGFYERLINGIADLSKNFKKNFLDLLPLGIGAAISIIAIAVGVQYGFNYAPVAIVSLFAGLILGFMPLLHHEVKDQKITAKPICLSAVSFVIAAAIGVLSAIAKIYWNFNLESAFLAGEWWIYILIVIAGFVAAAACIVPGISGAMILFILGLYNPVLGIFMGENSMFHNQARLGSGLGAIACLLLGILLGFVSMSKLMKGLLAKHHDATFNVVIGFVYGSVVSMFVNQALVNETTKTFVYASTPIWEWVIAPILLLLSFGVCFYFSRSYLNKTSKNCNISNTELK